MDDDALDSLDTSEFWFKMLQSRQAACHLREGYNFLSNLVQFPIVCILLYFVLYFAVF